MRDQLSRVNIPHAGAKTSTDPFQNSFQEGLTEFKHDSERQLDRDAAFIIWSVSQEKHRLWVWSDALPEQTGTL